MPNSSVGCLLSELAAKDMQSVCNANLCAMDHTIVPVSPSEMPTTSFGGIQFGGVDIFSYEGIGERNGNRGYHHIRENPSDDFLLLVPLNGSLKFSQSRRITQVERGNFAFLSTSRPFVSSITSINPQEASSTLEVKIPASLLRQRIPCIDDYCGEAIRIQPGTGHIMHSMLELGLIDGRSMSSNQAQRFAVMLIDAVANATCEAPEISALQKRPILTPQDRVLELAKSVIDRNLSNVALDAGLISELCGVSVRYLQSVFAARGLTISTYTREARLQQCREALRNPMLSNKSVLEIAMLWGFNEPAYFSRAYKARFGKSPTTERRESLSKVTNQ